MSYRIGYIILSILAVALSFSTHAQTNNSSSQRIGQEIITPIELNYVPCRSLRCGGGGDTGGGSSGGGSDGGGDSGPSPQEVDGDKIVTESKSFFESAYESIKNALNRALGNETETQKTTKEALANNVKQQEADAINAKPGDTTECPVEFYSGCKVTKVTDWNNPVLPIKRIHRISQGSAWSLGAGWHASIDSRIIWGTDIDIGKQIAEHQHVVADYTAIVEELDIALDHLENGFKDRIGYERPNAQTALEESIATLTAYKAEILPKVNEAQSTLATLASAQQHSNSRRALNHYTVDNKFTKEYEIGSDLVKWIAPNGGRYLFIQNDKGTITAVAGHNNQFTQLSSGEVEIRTPNGEKHRYNTKGLLTQSTNNQGQSISIGYNTQNKPAAMTTELGHVITLSYAGDRLVNAKDEVGRRTQYHYKGDQLHSVVQFDGKKQSYSYTYANEPLAITAKTDGQDNSWRYGYTQQDGKTVITSQIDAAGHQFSYQYDFLNDETEMTNRNGSKTRYQYDGNNKLISIIYDTDGSEINHIYDSKGNLLSTQNEVGDITRYSYNVNGERLSTTDGESNRTEFERDTFGRIITLTNGAGESTEHSYNAYGKVDSITKPDGSIVTQTWQGQLMTSRIDELGNIAEYQYDQNGYPAQITQYNHDTPSGDETIQRFSHDAIGRVNWINIGSENTPESEWRLTQYFYTTKDGRQLEKPTKVIDPLNRVALFDYNFNGLLTYQQDFSGVETFYTYTSMNKVASKRRVMPAANGLDESIEYHTQYQYDAENNLIEVTQPGGIVWQYQYDERNRLTRSAIKGTDVVKHFSYDEAGRKQTESNSYGDRRQFDYYNNNQLKQQIDLLGNTQHYFYDGAGQLTQITDSTRNSEVSFERNALGHIVEQTDANGNIVYITPDPLGQIVAISAPNSTETRQRHQLDWRGNKRSTTNALRGQWNYHYNAFGEQTKKATSAGASQTQHYDAIGRLVKRVDSSGLEITWQYNQLADRLDVVETQIDTLNIGFLGSKRESKKTYDLMGRLVQYQDSSAQQWQFDYNLQGLLSQTRHPDGSSITRLYNSTGQLAQLSQSSIGSESASRHTYYQYDSEGRLIHERLPQHEEGYGNQYQYDAAGNITTVTYADGSQVHYRYDTAGRKVEATYPQSLSERWQYDANDNVVSFIDRGEFEWRYRYDADNQLIEFCDPIAGDASCNDASRYQYDIMGNRTAHITPLGHTTRWQHTALGWVIKQTDPSENVTHYDHDRIGRITEITDPLGNKTEQSYTAFGELSRVTDPMRHTTQFYYDASGRLIERKNSLSASEQWAYNYRNQISQYTDALGNQTGYQYNAFGNLTEVNQPLDSNIQYHWNNAGQLSQVTEPMGGTQTFAYDERARLTQYTNQNGHQWQYQYDQLGQLTTQYQPESGTDIHYGYDALGRKTSEQFTHLGETQTNRWNYDAVGRLSGVQNPYLNESYAYDADSQLTQVNNHTLDEQFTYRYDESGRRTQSQLGNNQLTDYKYDSKGRITTITRTGNDDEALVFTLSYDEKDQIVRMDYPNNSRRWIGYDSEGRVTSIKVEQQWYTHRWKNIWNTVELFEYRYDAAGNLTAENRKTKEAYYDQWAYFEYDQLNRVIEADYPLHYDNYYRWDKNGNLVYKEAKGLEYKYEYDKANQLTGYRGNYYLWYEVEHDDNGNQTNETHYGYTFDYQYNALGQLTGFDKWDNTKVRYGYDSRGRRVSTKRSMTHSKNWGEFEQHSAYDGRQEFAQWIKDKDDTFVPFRTLTLLPKSDEPYSSVLHQRLYDKYHRLTSAVGTAAADIENLYIHSDRLDSSVHVLDKTGRMAMRLGYSALGRTYRKYDDVMTYYFDLEPLANCEFAQLMPYRYTGKFTDYSTGFVQMDSRWYNGHNGRFIQPDNWNLRSTHLPKAVQHELMQFMGLNTQQLLNDPSQQMAYGYVRGNPLKYVDPYGLNAMYVPDSYYNSVVQEDNKIEHYSRNDKNDKFLKDNNLYGRNDIKKEELEGAGDYGMKKAKADESVFHQQGKGNEANEKYTSKVADKENYIQKNISNRYGRHEVVVRPNEDGTYTHVNDDINMGTLNLGNNPVSHVIKDIAPYAEYGNKAKCDD